MTSLYFFTLRIFYIPTLFASAISVINILAVSIFKLILFIFTPFFVCYSSIPVRLKNESENKKADDTLPLLKQFCRKTFNKLMVA